MLTLYYAPDNASLVLRLAMEEADIPYGTVLVDRAARGQKAPDYLALNPCGKIPTLITPDGPLAETAAYLLWLSDAHPSGGLGPKVGMPARTPFLRWLFFLSNTVHADLNRIFTPHRVVPSDAVAAHHELMTARLVEHLRILDDACRDEPTLFAPPSALALYLGPILRWAALYPIDAPRWLDLKAFPTLLDLVVSLEARPAVQTASLAEGLGPLPFSVPRLPQPPEGSAT